MEGNQKGRKKIEIKKIKDPINLLVTFSKRKSGLFKSASELSTLCGADVGIVVFSPKGKPFAFGHPGVNSVIGRYLNQNPQTNNGIAVIEEALQREKIRDLNKELNEQLKQLENEKVQVDTLDKIQEQYGWQESINELGLHDLEQLSISIAELKRKVEAQVDELWINELLNEASSSLSFSPLNSIQGVNPFITYN